MSLVGFKFHVPHPIPPIPSRHPSPNSFGYHSRPLAPFLKTKLGPFGMKGAKPGYLSAAPLHKPTRMRQVCVSSCIQETHARASGGCALGPDLLGSSKLAPGGSHAGTGFTQAG